MALKTPTYLLYYEFVGFFVCLFVCLKKCCFLLQILARDEAQGIFISACMIFQFLLLDHWLLASFSVVDYMLLGAPQQHFAQRPTENKLYKKSCSTLDVARDVVCFLSVAGLVVL